MYDGEVISCELIHHSKHSYRTYGLKVIVQTSFEREETYYSTSGDVRPGDRVYYILSPGEGDEESTEPLRKFAVTFRDLEPHSKVTDRLMTPSQMSNISTFVHTIAERLSREYEALRSACVGRIELCSANIPSLDRLQERPGIVLAHISYTTMLTLVAWFKCIWIPEYIKSFNDINNDADIQLCRCPESAEIVIESAEQKKTMFSAPWYSMDIAASGGMETG